MDTADHTGQGHDISADMDGAFELACIRWLAFRQQLTCVHCGHDHWTAHKRDWPRAHWVVSCRGCQGRLTDPRGLRRWREPINI